MSTTYAHLRLSDGSSVPLPAHLIPHVRGERGGEVLFAFGARRTARVPITQLHTLTAPGSPLSRPLAVVGGTAHTPTPQRTIHATGPIRLAEPSPRTTSLACPGCHTTGPVALTAIPGAEHARCPCGHTWSGPDVAHACQAPAPRERSTLLCPRCEGCSGLRFAWYPHAPWHTASASCPCGHTWHPLAASSVALAYEDTTAHTQGHA